MGELIDKINIVDNLKTSIKGIENEITDIVGQYFDIRLKGIVVDGGAYFETWWIRQPDDPMERNPYITIEYSIENYNFAKNVFENRMLTIDILIDDIDRFMTCKNDKHKKKTYIIKPD